MAEPRAPKTPASALAPVAPRRAARTATRAAGTGQPGSPVVPTPGEPGPNSSLQPSERQAAGKPGPVPGTHGGLDDSSRAFAGSRAEASGVSAGGESPAGCAGGTGLPSAASADDEHAAQRKDWKAAQSAHNAAKRRGRTRRAPKQAGPGMIRRLPPGSDGAA
jgi:hypothetical protein